MPTHRSVSRLPAPRLTCGLGWLAIGLGVTQLLLPRTVARLLGMSGQERLLQWTGAAQAAAGVALLLTDRLRPPVQPPADLPGPPPPPLLPAVTKLRAGGPPPTDVPPPPY